MHIEWNKVTWYSKLIALILFILFPIIGFYFGIQYAEMREQILRGKEIALENIQNTRLTSKEIADAPNSWKTYRNGEYGFEFEYPQLGSGSSIEEIQKIPDDLFLKTISLGYNSSSSQRCLVLLFWIVRNNDSNSLLDWFSQYDGDVLLKSGSFQLKQVQGGGEMVLMTNPIPREYEGGPVGGAYVMSPSMDYVVGVGGPQDNDPSCTANAYGKEAREQMERIVSTFKFIR